MIPSDKKPLIYVYTGSGNSLWIANRLADLSDGEVYPMTGTVSNSETIGLVFPVHIWGVPSRVLEWVKHLKLTPETYFIAVVECRSTFSNLASA